jgi:hypothetical protein
MAVQSTSTVSFLEEFVKRSGIQGVFGRAEALSLLAAKVGAKAPTPTKHFEMACILLGAKERTT